MNACGAAENVVATSPLAGTLVPIAPADCAAPKPYMKLLLTSALSHHRADRTLAPRLCLLLMILRSLLWLLLFSTIRLLVLLLAAAHGGEISDDGSVHAAG